MFRSTTIFILLLTVSSYAEAQDLDCNKLKNTNMAFQITSSNTKNGSSVGASTKKVFREGGGFATIILNETHKRVDQFGINREDVINNPKGMLGPDGSKMPFNATQRISKKYHPAITNFMEQHSSIPLTEESILTLSSDDKAAPKPYEHRSNYSLVYYFRDDELYDLSSCHFRVIVYSKSSTSSSGSKISSTLYYSPELLINLKLEDRLTSAAGQVTENTQAAQDIAQVDH